MAAAAEECLVQYRDLQQRNLQAANQGLKRIRQGSIVENELEEHGDEVDDIVIDLSDHARFSGLGAYPAQQAAELLLQIEIVDRLWCAGLHMRQQAEQITAGDRDGIAGNVAGRQHAAATQLGKQIVQGAERGLLQALVDLNSLSGRGGWCMAAGRDAWPRLASRQSRLEFGQDTGCHQCLVGFGVELVEIAEYVFFEELEDDQLDLDFDAQAAAGLDEVVAKRVRAERVALVVELLADQRIHAGGQMA